jgi:hypothetical protein
MNSTYKNHAKIIKLAEMFDLDALYERYEENISFGEAYFNFIKKNNFTNMEVIFQTLFEKELYAIEYGNITNIRGKYLVDIINFVEDNFPEHYFYQKFDINGKEVIGQVSVPNIERGIKRMDKNPFLKLPPYCSGYESDYLTAIEIETIYEYKIPIVQIFACNENKFFIGENIDKCFKTYTISDTKYDSRAYGTHYM